MPTVTVDLEDLETLVLTAGAIKTVEGALAIRKNDPFVRPHLEFSAAHERLASAMRNARRSEAGTLVGWDDPLTDGERKLLRNYDVDPALYVTLPAKDKAPESGDRMSVVDRLAAKGCVQIGTLLRGVRWSEIDSVFTVDPCGFAVRITARGREALIVPTCTGKVGSVLNPAPLS